MNLEMEADKLGLLSIKRDHPEFYKSIRLLFSSYSKLEAKNKQQEKLLIEACETMSSCQNALIGFVHDYSNNKVDAKRKGERALSKLKELLERKGD